MRWRLEYDQDEDFPLLLPFPEEEGLEGEEWEEEELEEEELEEEELEEEGEDPLDLLDLLPFPEEEGLEGEDLEEEELEEEELEEEEEDPLDFKFLLMRSLFFLLSSTLASWPALR